MINPMDLTGRTILVTGASSGIGRGVAIQAAKLGAKVVIVARRQDRLEETAAMMEGAECHIAPYDLSEIDGISKFVKGVCEEVGPLNGFVHAAGIHIGRLVRQLKWEKSEPMMRLNYFAGSALTTAFRQRNCWATPQGGVIGMTRVQRRVRSLPASIRVEWASPSSVYWPSLRTMCSRFRFSPVRNIQRLSSTRIFSAKAFMAPGVSRSGSTLMETNQTSSRIESTSAIFDEFAWTSGSDICFSKAASFRCIEGGNS